MPGIFGIKLPKTPESKEYKKALKEKNTWDIKETLIYIEENDIPQVMIEVSSIEKRFIVPSITTYQEYLDHIRRVSTANLDKPIILGPGGVILDGRHRITKALLLDVRELPGYKLDRLPDNTFISQQFNTHV